MPQPDNFRMFVGRLFIRACARLIPGHHIETIGGVEVFGDEDFLKGIREIEEFIRINPAWGGKHWDSLKATYLLYQSGDRYHFYHNIHAIGISDSYFNSSIQDVIVLLVLGYNIGIAWDEGMRGRSCYERALDSTVEWLKQRNISDKIIIPWRDRFVEWFSLAFKEPVAE